MKPVVITIRRAVESDLEATLVVQDWGSPILNDKRSIPPLQAYYNTRI